MANLVLLCRTHHHTHHDGEFTIAPQRGGRFQFLRADGTALPTHSDPSTLIATSQPLDEEHHHVPDGAATTRWDGTHLDRHYAIATLAQNLNTTTRRSA